eukprot:4015673-Pleurochrysis_carterae.AAC.1
MALRCRLLAMHLTTTSTSTRDRSRAYYGAVFPPTLDVCKNIELSPSEQLTGASRRGYRYLLALLFPGTYDFFFSVRQEASAARCCKLQKNRACALGSADSLHPARPLLGFRGIRRVVSRICRRRALRVSAFSVELMAF